MVCKARHAELESAEKIVKDEVEQFLSWTRGLQVQPTIVAMRTKAHAVLFGELERSLHGRLKHLPEPDRAALAAMLESALSKLMHAPTTHLALAPRRAKTRPSWRALKFLFDLKEIPPGDEAGEGGGEERASDEASEKH